MANHPLLIQSFLPYCPLRLPTNHPLSRALSESLLFEKKVNPLADPLARDDRLAMLEAVLMLADEPIPLRRLVSALRLKDSREVLQCLERLKELYDLDGTAFQVRELAGGYQLQTRTVFHPWLARIKRGITDLKLSAAARETLTIIAYRQPITRADLEGVRGVQSGEVLRQLMEKGLVRIAGRDESLGRPVLYGTTKKFLQNYGLNSLKDLPMSDAMGIESGSSEKKSSAKKTKDLPNPADIESQDHSE